MPSGQSGELFFQAPQKWQTGSWETEEFLVRNHCPLWVCSWNATVESPGIQQTCRPDWTRMDTGTGYPAQHPPGLHTVRSSGCRGLITLTVHFNCREARTEVSPWALAIVTLPGIGSPSILRTWSSAPYGQWLSKHHELREVVSSIPAEAQGKTRISRFLTLKK